MALEATGSYFIERKFDGSSPSAGLRSNLTQLSLQLPHAAIHAIDALAGFTLNPLISSHFAAHATPGEPFRQWMLATPDASSGMTMRTLSLNVGGHAKNDTSPASAWDRAHGIASADSYERYVEPAFVQLPNAQTTATVPARTAAIAAPEGTTSKFVPFTNGPSRDYPPSIPTEPMWHRKACGLPADPTKGRGVRVAHLDTGYSKNHISKPRNIDDTLAYDFWSNKPGADDVANIPIGGLANPSHGTATLGLLAGSMLNLSWADKTSTGDLGIAPEATILPIRIGPGVAHFGGHSMAQALNYARAPNGDATMSCDVVTLSHGGVPVSAWATAVNDLYEAGVVVVAAAGDSFELIGSIPVLTHYTVYPSAFNRVITAVGTTFDNGPYTSDKPTVMQGSWGPPVTMRKAVAAPTPNVPWMRHLTENGWDMDGGGTSASTPQIAAACALWLELYRDRLPKDWRRVEACRLALFESAWHDKSKSEWLGNGRLNIEAMLDKDLADRVISSVMAQDAEAKFKEPVDSVSSPVWRILLGKGAPNSEKSRMYEVELTQLLHSSSNKDLASHMEFEREYNSGGMGDEVKDIAQRRSMFLEAFSREPMSEALRSAIYKA